MRVPALAADVAARFDHVLVDEYQDTNALQAAILLRLKPDGAGLTVVGDDAQAIYCFRAATVRNILDFPGQFDPPADDRELEQNYRSTQPILAAANAVIGLAARAVHQEPALATAAPASGRALVIGRATNRPGRAASSSACSRTARPAWRSRSRPCCSAPRTTAAMLEIELTRRNIPFVKYGGLKFLEAAHVKDVLASCAGPRTRATASPASASCSCCPASAPPPPAKVLDAMAGRSRDRCAGARSAPPAKAADALARSRRR